MKHWKIEETMEMHNKGINLQDGDLDRVLSIAKNSKGDIDIREGCDGYFVYTCPKAEAVEILQEAIDYIKSI